MYNTEQSPRVVSFETKQAIIRNYSTPLILGFVIMLVPTGLIAFVTLIFFSIQGDARDVDYDAIEASGKRVAAVITDIEVHTNVTLNDEHPATITFVYPSGDEERTGQFRTISPEEVSRLSEGDEIQVKYIGSDFLIHGLEPISFPIRTLLMLMIIFPIAGLPIVGLVVYKYFSSVNLYKHGRVVEATMVSISPASGKLRVRYRYKSRNGRDISGSSTTNDYFMINDKKIGDPVKVFVSSDDSRSCLVPRMDVTRNRWDIKDL